MPFIYNPTVQDRSGELLGAGIISAGHSLGTALGDAITTHQNNAAELQGYQKILGALAEDPANGIDKANIPKMTVAQAKGAVMGANIRQAATLAQQQTADFNNRQTLFQQQQAQRQQEQAGTAAFPGMMAQFNQNQQPQPNLMAALAGQGTATAPPPPGANLPNPLASLLGNTMGNMAPTQSGPLAQPPMTQGMDPAAAFAAALNRNPAAANLPDVRSAGLQMVANAIKGNQQSRGANFVNPVTGENYTTFGNTIIPSKSIADQMAEAKARQAAKPVTSGIRFKAVPSLTNPSGFDTSVEADTAEGLQQGMDLLRKNAGGGGTTPGGGAQGAPNTGNVRTGVNIKTGQKIQKIGDGPWTPVDAPTSAPTSPIQAAVGNAPVISAPAPDNNGVLAPSAAFAPTTSGRPSPPTAAQQATRLPRIQSNQKLQDQIDDMAHVLNGRTMPRGGGARNSVRPMTQSEYSDMYQKYSGLVKQLNDSTVP